MVSKPYPIIISELPLDIPDMFVLISLVDSEKYWRFWLHSFFFLTEVLSLFFGGGVVHYVNFLSLTGY